MRCEIPPLTMLGGVHDRFDLMNENKYGRYTPPPPPRVHSDISAVCQLESKR